MNRWLRARRSSLVLAGVAVYCLFLIAAPFEHHDLLCHLKTPLHCSSCTSSALGFVSGPPVVVRTPVLVDAGDAPAARVLVSDLLLPMHSTGRSPPSIG